MSNFLVRAAGTINPKAFLSYMATFGVEVTEAKVSSVSGNSFTAMGVCSEPWKAVLHKLESKLGKSAYWTGSGERTYLWPVKAPIGRKRTVGLTVEQGSVYNQKTDEYEGPPRATITLRDYPRPHPRGHLLK